MGIVNLCRIIKRNPKYSKRVKQILKKYGNKKISNLIVHRCVLPNSLLNFFNFMSLGDFYNKLYNHNIDIMYHVWFEIELEDFTNSITFDKNLVLYADVNNYKINNTEKMNISLNKEITLNEFIKNGLNKMGKKQFYKYILPNINCQNWCIQLLKANNIDITSYKSFIIQDNLLQNVTNVTNTNIVNKIINFFSLFFYYFGINYDSKIMIPYLYYLFAFFIILIILTIFCFYFLLKNIFNNFSRFIEFLRPIKISIANYEIQL